MYVPEEVTALLHHLTVDLATGKLLLVEEESRTWSGRGYMAGVRDRD